MKKLIWSNFKPGFSKFRVNGITKFGIMAKLLFYSTILFFFIPRETVFSFQQDTKNILILVEGNTDSKSIPVATGRQLSALLGHFQTKNVIKGVNQYVPGEISKYDFTFYIGDKAKNLTPEKFLNDVLTLNKQIIWLGTGMIEFSKAHDLKKAFGFNVNYIDSIPGFDIVKYGSKVFTKGDKPTNIIEITDRKQLQVLATAYSTARKKEVPYIVKSKNLLYFADSPFSYADETDRYLLFADMLHDILGEQHEESHSAIIRIEDISPMDNPDKLRDIADLLSKREIPFLVSVIPFYVNPGTGVHLSMSDKPDLVDALKYMVKNGGSLVMHGSTHQYKGVTAADFEFWDAMTNKPIKDENEAMYTRKIEAGIQELMKNGLYPIAWETPHYTASILFYKTISKYFSTAVEPRLAVEDFDQSQYFPYVINKDLYGQKIIPENLGYVPYDPDDKNVSWDAVKRIIKGAKYNLQVRDGFASCFFHEFNDLDLLEAIVDGVTALGYKYIDLSDQVNWVKTKDRVILTGSQDYKLKLDGQYLVEAYYDSTGEIKQKNYSDQRITGDVEKSITLATGELYRAEPVEYREKKLTFWEKFLNKVDKVYHGLFVNDNNWNEARIAILWNHFAKGSAFNDQASFASVFKSVNINVDTIFVGEKINLQKYNLLIVPYAFVDSLKDNDYETISNFVYNGGNIITDNKNSLADGFNIKFANNTIRIGRVRDKFFPEEAIKWKYSELVHKIEVEDKDEVLCYDEISKMPMVIGRQVGKGKLIFFNSRFDPYSQQGYSLYPYLLEYVKSYFNLRPVVRHDNLDIYFEPGYRGTFSIENLIKQWVNEGVRIIHVSGWVEYEKKTYDYKRLINLAHSNGMLVYAWLEPPQVSKKFWDDHPEWREKNYKNEDKRPSWRYPVALTDPKCVAAVNDIFKNFLENYDWDGVNFAELYFEAGKGLNEPDLFTPMHPSAKSEVLKKYGIDLGKIFDPSSNFYWKSNPYVEKSITEYRVNKLNELYEIFLPTIKQIADKKSGFEVIVTAMDSFGSPELRANIAVDMKNIIALQKKYGFTLQVQDAENLWSTDPMRYIDIGNRYKKLLGDDSKLLLDLNILNFRKENEIIPFPTLIQTGTESFELIKSAAIGAPRFTIYCESSVNPQDMPFFPYASSVNVKYNYTEHGYNFESPYSFTVKLPPKFKAVNVDGSPISPYRDNLFTIPAGTHEVAFVDESMTSFSTHELQAKILAFTGNLTEVTYGLQDVKFSYESQIRTLISLNREPTYVKVDGEEYKFIVMKGNDCFSFFLPLGKHSVELTAGDSFSYGINLTSLWSSTGIAIFGALAVVMLSLMFILLKIIRRKYSTT